MQLGLLSTNKDIHSSSSFYFYTIFSRLYSCISRLNIRLSFKCLSCIIPRLFLLKMSWSIYNHICNFQTWAKIVYFIHEYLVLVFDKIYFWTFSQLVWLLLNIFMKLHRELLQGFTLMIYLILGSLRMIFFKYSHQIVSIYECITNLKIFKMIKTISSFFLWEDIDVSSTFIWFRGFINGDEYVYILRLKSSLNIFIVRKIFFAHKYHIWL